MNIPGPLLDRMEVIRLPGYTEDEKVEISKSYLLPKQKKNNGLKEDELQVSDAALRDIVRYYTREAGVRSIEREIAKICRKVVKEVLLSKKKTDSVTKVTPKNLDKYLGVKRFRYGVAENNDQIGQVNGLAWTEVGGELLTIESAVMPGKGKFSYTGQLGDVMQESIQAAMTVIRSRAASLGLKPDFQDTIDIHVHVPEGATPKDGPSAGVGMCTALASSITKKPVNANVAMTGEITLRGEVLPIGGLKEKLLAAHRAGIKIVLIPQENEKDLIEIPKHIKRRLKFIPVQNMDEVLQVALVNPPIWQEVKKSSSRVTKPSRPKTSLAS
jgi:ATP-dependent Lon protease